MTEITKKEYMKAREKVLNNVNKSNEKYIHDFVKYYQVGSLYVIHSMNLDAVSDMAKVADDVFNLKPGFAKYILDNIEEIGKQYPNEKDLLSNLANSYVKEV